MNCNVFILNSDVTDTEALFNVCVA